MGVCGLIDHKSFLGGGGSIMIDRDRATGILVTLANQEP